MSERLWYLKHCDLFERLTTEQIRLLESRSRTRTFSPRSSIYLPGDAANSVFLLVSGRARISHLTQHGKESILAFIEPGELFGELSVIEGGQRDEYVTCTQQSTVVRIPVDEMQRLMDAHPTVSFGITKLIGLRRKRIERRLKHLLFASNRDRLIYLLLELVEQYGSRNGDGIELGIRLSHQELASLIGSTRETVTVTLGQLQSEGAIQVRRKSIVLVNIDQLAHTVGQPVPRLPPIG